MRRSAASWASRSHVLQLEETVFWPWAVRATEAAPARGREHEAQEAGRGPEPGQGHVAGRRTSKNLKPARRRELVNDLQARYGASQTQACAVMMLSRSVYHYRARRRDQTPLVNRIKEIAAARVRYGYQRVHILLRREGWRVNRKRVYRLYRLEGLSLFQRRPRRHRSAMQRNRPPGAQARNECWSMDFVSDQLTTDVSCGR